jgi:CrcB protein
MRFVLYAAAGGGIGAAARHLVNVGFGRWLAAGFPWSTLFVNVVGSFLMGALIEAFALKFKGSLELRTFLATGVLGGFTTFSAFSMDFAHLMQRHDTLPAAAYVVASVVLSIAALYAGLWLVRWLVT